MLFIFLYLGALFIAPHDWLEPFVGLRVDLFLYPAWLLFVMARGGVRSLVRLGPQDLLFIGMITWMVLSISFNGFDAGFGGGSAAIVQNYLKWFMMFRLTVATVETLPQVRAALVMVLFYGLVLAAEGIQHMHSASGTGWAGQDFAWMDELAASSGVAGRTRWVSNFDGPGVFCVAYTVAVPVALVLVGKPYGALTRLVGLLMLAPLVLATVYTGSRGGFLATVGVIGLYLMIKSGISVTRLAIAGTVALVLLVVAPAHLTSTRDSHSSAQHRIEMWARGIEMVTTYPVLGVGKGAFASYTKSLIAHNSGIEIAGETGLPGLFLWIGIIYLGFRNLLRAYRETADVYVRATLTALALSIAGYLLSALFVTLEYELLYFLLALTCATGLTLKEPQRFTLRDAAIVAGIALAFLAIVKAVAMVYF